MKSSGGWVGGFEQRRRKLSARTVSDGYSMKRQTVVDVTICSYPKCDEDAVGSILRSLPMCKTHIELAEFFLWLEKQRR